jgi:hypothetical protein
MLDLFGDIASTMYGDPELEEGVTVKRITSKNREYFVKLYEDRAKAHDAAKKVTEFVTGRSWVMSEFGPNTYRFTHRTFMEFFFARNLEEQHETVEALLGALLPQIVGRQWDVISHLALQMKSFRSQKRTSQAIKLLQEFARKERLDVARSTPIYVFFGNALSYMIPSEIECKAALLEILDGAFNILASGEIEGAASVIVSITACVPAGIRTPARASAKQALRKFAEIDAFAANIYAEWYRESIPELLGRHGIGMFFIDKRPWVKSSRHTAVFAVNLLFMASSYYRSVEVKEGTRILEIIGRWQGTLPPLSETRGEGDNRVFFPPEMWVQIVGRCKKNLYALRGMLLLYRIMDDTIHERPAGKRGRDPAFPNAVSVLADPVGKAISALSSKDQELFSFWPPYGVWG